MTSEYSPAAVWRLTRAMKDLKADVVNVHKPLPFSLASPAASLARDYFGVDGTAAPLPNERDQNFVVTTRGGDLTIAWAGPGQPVMMTGPAVTVFTGEIEL